MFGNRLGWSFSAVIVVLTAVFLWQLSRQGRPSEPGELGRRAGEHTIMLPVPGARLAPYMTEPYEAAPLYAEAVLSYEAAESDMRRIDELRSLESPAAVELAKILEPVVKASRSARPGVLGGKLLETINYGPERPRIERLRALGKGAVRLGLLHGAAKRPEEARRYFEAALALGLKMFEERLIWEEFDAGFELMGDASAALARLAETSGSAAAEAAEAGSVYREFAKQRIDFYNARIKPLHHAIKSISPYTADMIALAYGGGDHLWRVEATLALGRCKFSASRFDVPYPQPSPASVPEGAGHFGDQQAARRALDQLTNDADVRVQVAAHAARALGVEQFRKLR